MVLLYLLLLVDFKRCFGASYVFWASHPTFPNESSIVSGYEFNKSSKVLIIDKNINIDPIYINSSSLSFTMPDTLTLSIYSCQIIDSNNNNDKSNIFYINKAELWWVQGNEGDHATPNGWIRVFGKSLFFDENQYIKKLKQFEKNIQHYSKVHDWINVQRSLNDINYIKKQISKITATPKLKLIHINNANNVYYLNAIIENCTLWHSYFVIPSNFQTSTYMIEYSNGLNNYTIWSQLSMFIDADNFNVSTFDIRVKYEFPTKIFNVVDYNHSFEDTYYSSNTNGWIGYKWDIPLQRALNAAKQNNGGIVYFPRGKYYILGSIQIPNNTLIVGEATELVSIYFQEKASLDAIPSCYPENKSLKRYFCGELTTNRDEFVRWGLKHFTFYISSYHSTVIEIHNQTNKFIMDGVRARVNSWFYQNQQMNHEQNIFNNSKQIRFANYSFWSTGELILMHARNWQIINCDLFTDNTAINSFNYDVNNRRHSTQWGYLGNNVIYNGNLGGCHPMDAWQQVIVENNLCDGGSLFSGGNALGSSEGGYAQHYYSSNNKISKIWGNDREVITFDDAGGSYYGPIQSISGNKIITMYDTKQASGDRLYGWNGGSMMIINGSGEGQYRRIINAGIHTQYTAQNRTWIINDKFDIEPETGNPYGSFIQIYTFRGRVIWSDNEFIDVGSFQTYGTSTEVILANNKFERSSKIIFDGQWRGWVPVNNTNNNNNKHNIGGPMGIGIQPSIRNIMYGNIIKEGNSMSLYYDGLWTTNVFAIQSGTESGGKYTPNICPPTGWNNIIKKNIILNSGGIHIGYSVHDAIIEYNEIYNSSFGIRIDLPQQITPLVVRNNNIKPQYFCCHKIPNIGPG